MEGNTQQYQIRTMALDLERARGKSSYQTPPLPKKETEVRNNMVGANALHEERKLQDILSEARLRVAEAPKEPPKPPAPSSAQKTLQDILPIEPPSPEPHAVQGPVRRSPALPAGRFSEGGPPSNLPTGEPSLPSSPREEKTILPSPVKNNKRTPEEILGIADKLPKFAPIKSADPIRKHQKETVAAKKVRSLPAPRFVLFAGFLAIVIIGLGYGIYWKISRREAPTAPPVAQKTNEQPPPEALIQTIETETIELFGLSYDDLKPKIDALEESKLFPESLVYIPVKFSTREETRYLTLLEIFEVLQIDAPPILYDHKNFTLYLYSQGAEARKLCDEAGIVSKSCYGPRIGIVIEFPDRKVGALTKDAALSVMGEWEKTITADLGPLMLAIPKKTGAQFARGKYKGFDASFINLPISTTSIDWILTDTHLIIATSKDAARAAVDALK